MSGDPRRDPAFIRANRSKSDGGLMDRKLRVYNLGPKPYGLGGDLIVKTKATSRYLIITLINGNPHVTVRATTWERALIAIRIQFEAFPYRWSWLIDQKLGGVVGVQNGETATGFVTNEGKKQRWLKGEQLFWEEGTGEWVTRDEIFKGVK